MCMKTSVSLVRLLISRLKRLLRCTMNASTMNLHVTTQRWRDLSTNSSAKTSMISSTSWVGKKTAKFMTKLNYLSVRTKKACLCLVMEANTCRLSARFHLLECSFSSCLFLLISISIWQSNVLHQVYSYLPLCASTFVCQKSKKMKTPLFKWFRVSSSWTNSATLRSFSFLRPWSTLTYFTAFFTFPALLTSLQKLNLLLLTNALLNKLLKLSLLLRWSLYLDSVIKPMLARTKKPVLN